LQDIIKRDPYYNEEYQLGFELQEDHILIHEGKHGGQSRLFALNGALSRILEQEWGIEITAYEVEIFNDETVSMPLKNNEETKKMSENLGI
jgi:hypothetical protein